MANPVGLLFSAFAGGSRGLSDSMEQSQKVSDEQMLMKQRSDLEEQKALRIAEASRQATRQAGIQQGQDINSATSTLQNQRDADAINAANQGVEGGSSMTAADAQVLRNNPEARKAYGLLSPTRQSDLEDRATAATNLGYLDAARETRGELQTAISDKRAENQDTNTNRRLDLQEQLQQQQSEYNQRRESRMDRLAEAQLSFQKSRANKDDARAEQMATREERSATAMAMKGAETEIKQLEKDIADPMIDPKVKSLIQSQIDSTRLEARRYRERLSGAGIDGDKQPDKPFNPADFRPSSGGTPSPSGAKSQPIANPFQPTATPAVPTAQSIKQTAIAALDSSLRRTGQQLAAANASGDKAEVQRLQSQFEQQRAARDRANQ